MIKSQHQSEPNPILTANFFSKLFFLWTRHIFKKGFSKELGPEDIYENIPALDSSKITKSLAEQWKIELQRKKPSLLRVILRTYGPKVLPYAVLYIIFDITIHAVQPLFVSGMVSYFVQNQDTITKEKAYVYGACLSLLSFAEALGFSMYNTFIYVQGYKLRVACAGLVYQKCLKIPTSADSSEHNSLAISIVSKDITQIDPAIANINNVFRGPIEVLVYAVLMWTYIGWPAVIGIIVFVIIQPFQVWGGKATSTFKRGSTKCGDERISLVNELITAIQVIKMYAWEKFFTKKISVKRKRETDHICNAMKINAFLQSSVIISKLALLVYLLTLLLTGKKIEANLIFTASLYYSNLSDSVLMKWSTAITLWAEVLVSFKRMSKYLLQDEQSALKGVDNLGLELIERFEEKNPIVRIHNENSKEKYLKLHQVSCSWEKSTVSRERIIHIRNIDITISNEQFVGVVGKVGSGKTTLLNAITGECELIQGSIELNGVLSYSAQDPWIFGGSIRENIVFVEKFDERRYKDVLYACELNRDIDMMPNGDLTIIGERGINLSGGQKARINLARAIYRKADIYLFDDPLSAVDTYVGRRLMDKCFLKFLNDKIRIMVTHQTQYMLNVSHLIYMADGCIKTQGPYHQLRKVILKEMQAEQKSSDYTESKPKSKLQIDINEPSNMNSDETWTETKDVDRKEYQTHGPVKFSTFLSYFRALRSPSSIFGIFSLFILARVCQGALDIFTAKWATLEESRHLFSVINGNIDPQLRTYLIIFVILTGATLGLYFLRTFSFFYMCYKISIRLHDMLLDSIVKAQMLFFDLNSSGRILNRFSSDLYKADAQIPIVMENSFWFFVDIIAILLIVGLTNYWLLIPSFLLMILLQIIRYIYIRSSRNLKRVESISCSPILSHINQTFKGLTTIRALNASDQVQLDFNSHQNSNVAVWYLNLTTSRAMSLWIDLMSWIYITSVTICLLFLKDYVNSGQVGLALTQSILLLGKCQLSIRRTAEMENFMTSVERILEYTRTPQEIPQITPPEILLEPNWPNKGRICFKNLYLRYTESSPYILKGINLSIAPKEKIGIVGRTGAGKSSIIQALFRLAINEGLIEIDGQDISVIGLQDLRRFISIIPQEPLLFTGTLRSNLDPFEEKTDSELWCALENVELKEYVQSLEGGLECQVYDGGVNFSTGQRQLVCLARAILRHNKILIMDEATANVDSNTDQLIQEKIKMSFSECTVITIAHRLKTVMHNDRVLVMDAGHIAELDHPYLLLQNENGLLYNLVQETGKETAEYLMLLAEKNFKENADKENYTNVE